MSLKFSYKRIDYGEGHFTVPKIPIILEGESSQFFMGLLDSGATHAFIPRKIAELIELDLDEKNEIKVTAIGSKVSGIETTMRITIPGQRGKNYSARVPVTVLNDGDIDEIILGRIGLFNLFKVTFHENEKYVILKPYPESQIPKEMKV